MGDHETRYAGLVVFAATLFSLLTGLAFSVMVTRRISIGEYGILQFYSTMMAYLVLPGTVIGYWLTRDLGRGRQVLTIGVATNNMLGILAAFSLFLISMASGEPLKLTASELVAIAMNLYLLYLSSTLDSASIGVAPVLQGEGLILEEVAKLIVGWIVIVLMRTDLLGVLLSIDAGLLCKCVFMYLRLPRGTRGPLDSSVAVRWLRRGWVPLFAILPGLIASADLLVIPLLIASTVLTAYLGLAKTLAAIILYANSLSVTLYSKLLSGKGRAEIEDAFRLVMMFAIPMATGLSVLALPITQLFGEDYTRAAVALQLLSVAALFNVFRGFSLGVLQGREGADIDPNRPLSDLLRSNLVVPRLWELLAQLIYVSVSLALASYMWNSGSPPESIVTTLAIVGLLVAVPLSLWMWRLSTKACAYGIPWRDLASYATSAAVMSVSVIVVGPVLMESATVYEMGLRLFLVVALGAFVYFLTLLITSRRVRTELRSILKSKP